MFRGTLRYRGYAELMGAFHELGLLNTMEEDGLGNLSWAVLLSRLLRQPDVPSSASGWRTAVAAGLGGAHREGEEARVDRVVREMFACLLEKPTLMSLLVCF